MIILDFGPADLRRIRFGISPLWETVAALEAVRVPGRQPAHLRWLRAVGGRLAGLDTSTLEALLGGRYVPDFLTPPPGSPLADVADELDRVRATPPERVRQELEWAFADRPVPAAGARLLADPATTPGIVADLLGRVWKRLLADDWPRLRDLLDADVLHRSRLLALGGAEQMVPDLHPLIEWAGSSLRVRRQHDQRRALDGAGLLLVPSVFAWPRVHAVLDEPWQPTLIYPARGAALLWERPAEQRGQLAALVGRSRAELLASIAEPATTTQLAARHGLSLGSVSQHLGVLAGVGLAHRRRAGRVVLYELTPLGHAVLSAG